MKMMRYFRHGVFLLAALFIAACTGGGGGAPQPTTAVVKLLTVGTLASGIQIGGIDVTLHLPSGVTVKTETKPPQTDSGVVIASGVTTTTNSYLISTFTPSTNDVRILVVNSDGFGFATGEYVTVNCDIASGSHPVPTDFTVTSMTVKDLIDANAINGLTAGITADIQ